MPRFIHYKTWMSTALFSATVSASKETTQTVPPVTLPPCTFVNLRITGASSDTETSQNYDKSSKISLRSILESNCQASQMTVKWTLQKAETDGTHTVLASRVGLQWVFPPGSFQSGQSYQVSVVAEKNLGMAKRRKREAAASALGSTSAYFEISKSPLVAGIARGLFRNVWYYSNFTLDACTYTYDPDARDQKEHLTFDWFVSNRSSADNIGINMSSIVENNADVWQVQGVSDCKCTC